MHPLSVSTIPQLSLSLSFTPIYNTSARAKKQLAHSLSAATLGASTLRAARRIPGQHERRAAGCCTIQYNTHARRQRRTPCNWPVAAAAMRARTGRQNVWLSLSPSPRAEAAAPLHCALRSARVPRVRAHGVRFGCRWSSGALLSWWCVCVCDGVYCAEGKGVMDRM